MIAYQGQAKTKRRGRGRVLQGNEKQRRRKMKMKQGRRRTKLEQGRRKIKLKQAEEIFGEMKRIKYDINIKKKKKICGVRILI